MDFEKDAIDAAFKQNVGALYKVLSNAFIVADGDQVKIDGAVARFKRGVQIEKAARSKALEALGIADT